MAEQEKGGFQTDGEFTPTPVLVQSVTKTGREKIRKLLKSVSVCSHT